MKRSISLVALCVAIGGCGSAPVAPKPIPVITKSPVAVSSPPPGDPSPVVEGDVTVAWVRGIQILVQRVPDAEFAVSQIVVRGGARNWSEGDAGIEDLALRVASQGGTQSLDKKAFHARLGALGASVETDTTVDFSRVTAKSPTAQWEESFALLADVLLRPALPASEFEIERARSVADRRHEMETGEGRLAVAYRDLAFAGHPYAKRAEGTEKTLTAMKAGDLAVYLAKLRESSRLVLVVVGDVDPARVVEQARHAFADVPHGSYVETAFPPLHYEAPRMSGDAFAIPTSYVRAVVAAPKWTDPDFIAMRLAMRVLHQRLWDEVRTKRGLSYAPAAHMYEAFGAPFASIYVTAVDPTKTLSVMSDEAHRLRNEPVPDAELAAAKALFVTRSAESEETTSELASHLADAQIYGGDWHLAKTLRERVRATTAAEIQAAAQRYLVRFQTAIVGDPQALDPKVLGALSTP